MISSETLIFLLTSPLVSIKNDDLLLEAVSTNSTAILEIILWHDPTVINLEIEGMRTLLMASFYSSSLDLTTPLFLLENGADPNPGIAAHMSPFSFTIGAQKLVPVIEKMI